MITREQIAALRRIESFLNGENVVLPATEDVVTLELITDDLEAALDAYEIWIGKEAEISEAELVKAAEDADVQIPY